MNDTIFTGANMIILPGLLCDHRMFARQLEAFPQCSVITGFYAGYHRLERMAEHVLAKMPARVSLLGHSMGARVALEVMRQAPDRVERLALVDTGVHAVRPGEQEKRYALRDLGRVHGMPALVDHWLPPMMAPEARKNALLSELLRSMCIDAGLAVYGAQIEALLNRPSVEHLLPKIECPTYVIVGSEDEWSPPSQHKEIVDVLPNGRLLVVQGAGHMLPCEKPAAFNRGIREWLAWTGDVA